MSCNFAFECDRLVRLAHCLLDNFDFVLEANGRDFSQGTLDFLGFIDERRSELIANIKSFQKRNIYIL